MTTKLYRPTKGDKAYVALMRNRDAVHSLDQAIAIRRVSDAYLADMAALHAGERSAHTRALVNVELARRHNMPARSANWIAVAAILVSLCALIVSIAARPSASSPPSPAGVQGQASNLKSHQ